MDFPEAGLALQSSGLDSRCHGIVSGWFFCCDEEVRIYRWRRQTRKVAAIIRTSVQSVAWLM